MTAAYLVPCLVVLRTEFNRHGPGRDTGADGWIGDAAHQAKTSDHNPRADGRVLALDVDSTGPWPAGYSFDQAVSDIVFEHRAGRDDRLEYVIWNRVIAERSNDYRWRIYDGTDKHTGHAHFSARHNLHGSTDVSHWGVTMNPLDIDKIAEETADRTVAKLLPAKLGRSDVTVAQALQNTEAQTRGLAADVETLLANTAAG